MNMIGHNSGVIPADATLIAETLRIEHADAFTRAEELLLARARAPQTIPDDETNLKVADFVKQIAGAVKLLETARTTSKAPYLEGGRGVDAVFAKHLSDLAGLKAAMADLMNRFVRDKAAAERKRLMDEAAAQAAAAIKQNDEVAFEQAVQSSDHAAAAKPAAIVRAVSDYGTVATAQTVWTFEVDEYGAVALEKLRPYLNRDEIDKAIRAFIRAGGRDLGGVKIFQTEKAMVR